MSEQPPEGVRLRFSNGTVVECTLHRVRLMDRKVKKGTVAYWAARPVSHVDPALTYEVECDRFPSMTGIHVETGTPGRQLLDWVDKPGLEGPSS